MSGSDARKPSDEELMALLDGELSARETRELEARVAADPEAQQRVAALRQLSAVVGGHYRGEADAMEPQLAGLWGRIEAQLDEAPAPARKRGETAARADGEEAGGFWAKLAELLTPRTLVIGVCGAAAGALLTFNLVGRGRIEIVTVKEPIQVAVPPVEAVAAAQATEIEQLDVASGSGMVFQVPSDDANEPATTVIWVMGESGEAGTGGNSGESPTEGPI